MLNIINNLPEALVPSDITDCLNVLHYTHYNLRRRPYLSFTVCDGHGGVISVGDDLSVDRRWWQSRPKGDTQRMLFPGFRRARVDSIYTGADTYAEIQVTMPLNSDGCYYHCPRTLVYQPGGSTDRGTLVALRIHGMSSANITSIKQHLGWH
jgi:hypothetical protein